jgi:hypothetical protein
MSTVPMPTLDVLVGWIESRNDPMALRFEPKVYADDRHSTKTIVTVISRCNHCSMQTAKMLCACSLGEFQIMGFNLYSGPLNYRGDIGHYFEQRGLQRELFFSFCAVRGIDYTVSDLAISDVKRKHFAEAYNGSLEYATNIVNALNHFGVKVQ